MYSYGCVLGPPAANGDIELHALALQMLGGAGGNTRSPSHLMHRVAVEQGLMASSMWSRAAGQPCSLLACVFLHICATAACTGNASRQSRKQLALPVVEKKITSMKPNAAGLVGAAHPASGSLLGPRPPPIRSQAELLRRIYTTEAPANACVRLLNATGAVGCAGDAERAYVLVSTLVAQSSKHAHPESHHPYWPHIRGLWCPNIAR